MLGFADLMPDCWLEVSLQPEDPAAGQLDPGLTWFYLVTELVPKPYVALHASHSTLPMVT
jgi:hypothetical protein